MVSTTAVYVVIFSEYPKNIDNYEAAFEPRQI